MQQQFTDFTTAARLPDADTGFSLASTLQQYEVEELLPSQAARLLRRPLPAAEPRERARVLETER